MYNKLAAYTLTHPDPQFIHQEIVDAYALQHASKTSKPIFLAFALIGLYLYLEKGFTGRQVQKAHMALANRRKNWPRFPLPENRGVITIKDVLDKPAGPERDAMINNWCESAWDAFSPVHKQVGNLLESTLNK